METRNITFSLPAELIRKAKVYAAGHETTVNALVRELLDEKLAGEDSIRIAAGRFLEIARRGPASAVDPALLRRQDLYERR